MAKIKITPVGDIPGDGKIEVVFSITDINPKNEAKAGALMNQAQVVFADGKIDTFEIFTSIGLILALGKL